MIASSGVLHFFKAPNTNSIYLTHRPDRADQNCPAFSIPRMTKYCNKYCNAGENVLLHRQKCVIEHRDIRHSLRSSPPDCFCQMLRIWSLVSQVQILQINKKRKQDILKNVLLPFGRGDKNIGVKFGLAAGFLPFCTATVLQRRSHDAQLLHIGVCCLCVLVLIIGEHIAVGV